MLVEVFYRIIARAAPASGAAERKD
jgi:hypothetical protein